MEVKRIEPSFGMVIKNPKTPHINTYLDSLPPKVADKFVRIAESDMNNKIPVYLTMLMNRCKPKFVVEVGGKRFAENIFQGPLTVLRRGVRYAQKLNAEQEAVNKAWGDNYTIPRL